MKNVAIYTRTSTDRQDTGLEAQERALLDYCSQRGIQAPLKFSDAGISGSKASRPGLNALLLAAREGQIGIILVYSFSRFARNTRHLLDSLEEFERLGISFVSLTENLDTKSAIGKALFTIISAISQLERELISERVKNGLNNARAKGKVVGRKKTRPSELIQALHTQGMTYREIAKLAHCSHGAIATELKQIRAKALGIVEDELSSKYGT